MNAAEIATKAASLVSGEREAQHGDKAENFQNIATLWNAWLAIKWRTGYPAGLTASDVGIMMSMLKMARTETGKFNLDDFIDGAAYLACSGELSQPTETMR